MILCVWSLGSEVRAVPGQPAGSVPPEKSPDQSAYRTLLLLAFEVSQSGSCWSCGPCLTSQHSVHIDLLFTHQCNYSYLNNKNNTIHN